jgi:hypothetical protein
LLHHSVTVVFNPADSCTCAATVAVVVIAGTAPVAPPPAHDTFHITVAVTLTAPGAVNVCPHVGLAARGSVPAVHAVPGPLHDTVAPSLVVSVNRAGTAVAVTDNPGTDAVADRDPHEPPSNHTHVGSPTNCGAGGAGFNRITGAGNRSAFTAASAKTAALGGLLKTRYLVIGKKSGGVPHDPMYHCPGGAGGGNTSGNGASSAGVIGRQ